MSITLIFSCGKDDDNPSPEPEANCRIAQADYTSDEVTYSNDFNYDGQDRLNFL